MAETDQASSELIGKCHDAVLQAAKPYGAARVAFSTAGERKTEADDVTAPIMVTAVYLRQGGPESRRAVVECRLNEAGDVIALR